MVQICINTLLGTILFCEKEVDEDFFRNMCYFVFVYHD